jgi:hypothetical protein
MSDVNGKFKGANHNNGGINAHTHYPKITVVSILIECPIANSKDYEQNRK